MSSIELAIDGFTLTRFDLAIDTEGLDPEEANQESSSPPQDGFAPVDRLAQSKLDQKLEVYNSVLGDEVFGCSMDADDAQEKGSHGGSDKSGNINELSIGSIKLAAKDEKDEEQLELEKEFENQMKDAGLGLMDASQGEQDVLTNNQ